VNYDFIFFFEMAKFIDSNSIIRSTREAREQRKKKQKLQGGKKSSPTPRNTKSQ
jgi:hypothetical protein